MAQELHIYTKCTQCSGTGQWIPPGTKSFIPCNWPGCTNGYIEFHKFTLDPGLNEILDKVQDVKDKCNNIKDKCDAIKDKVDQIWDAVKP